MVSRQKASQWRGEQKVCPSQWPLALKVLQSPGKGGSYQPLQVRQLLQSCKLLLAIDTRGENGWALAYFAGSLDALEHRLTHRGHSHAANSLQFFPELKGHVVTCGQEPVSSHTSLTAQSREPGPSPGLAVAWTFSISVFLSFLLPNLHGCPSTST